jgi:hypothetical protein
LRWWPPSSISCRRPRGSSDPLKAKVSKTRKQGGGEVGLCDFSGIWKEKKNNWPSETTKLLSNTTKRRSFTFVRFTFGVLCQRLHVDF